MDKNVLDMKSIWNDILKYVDVDDFYNMELAGKTMRSIITKYYSHTLKDLNENNIKEMKKLFFLKYFNSFVIFNVNDEFYNKEDLELKNNTKFFSNSKDNTIFQKNIIQDIIVKEDKLFILYHNSELKIFTSDLNGNYTLEMKFNLSNLKIDKMIFINEITTLVFLDQLGKLYRLYYPNVEELIDTNEVYLSLSEISLNLKINDIFHMKEYLIIMDEKQNLYYLQTIQLSYKEDEDQSILSLHNIERNNFNIIKINGCDSNLMFIDDLYNVSYINPHDLAKGINLPRKIPNYKAMNVCEMSSGDSHWLLLQRQNIESIDKWKENEVIDWFKSMNLDEYCNVIKYTKINGRDIIEGDESFFINVMGMEVDHIKKIKYEISRVKDPSCKNVKLQGWGSNKSGQLGQNNVNTFLKTPNNISIPELNNINDFVSNIFCGKTFSLLLTKFGEIYITGNYNPKVINQNIEQTNSQNKKNSKQDNKIHKWVNITKLICFDSLNDSGLYTCFFKAKKIYINENRIYFFGYRSNRIPFTLQDKKPKLKHLKKGDKFPTSDEVIQKLIKNKKKIEHYLIVYDDKLLNGLLETKLNEFLISDVPYHKIIQIKYFNDIIWDRKKRFYDNKLNI